jgi:hypothetical protein
MTTNLSYFVHGGLYYRILLQVDLVDCLDCLIGPVETVFKVGWKKTQAFQEQLRRAEEESIQEEQRRYPPKTIS